MQTNFSFHNVKLALLGISVLALSTSGCVESGGKPDPQLNLKIDAIRQAGYPVTLAELDAWYAKPPPTENGATLYGDAFAELASTEATAPSFLAENQKTLELLHVAASWKTCRYPMDLTKGYETVVPHLRDLKTCVKLLSQAANSQSTKGEMELATKSLLDGLRLAQSVEEEPFLISHLLQIAATTTIQTGLESALNSKAFTDEQLVRLQETFREVESRASMTRSTIAERCMGISILQLRVPDRATLFAQWGGTAKNIDIEAYEKSSDSNADFNFFLDRMDECVGLTTLPFPKNLKAISQWAAHVSEAKTKGYLFSGTLLPALAKALYRGAEHVGQLRVTQATLAVERFRLAHQNALPASLGELVPQFVDTVPTDPFDGQPLRYIKTSPKGFVIYGLGKDRNDDGGTPKLAGAKTGTPYDLTFVVRR